jgi:hypothetical protein
MWASKLQQFVLLFMALLVLHCCRAAHGILQLPIRHRPASLLDNTTHRRRRLVSGPAEYQLQFGLGTHYVELFVGNPPQRVSLIVDTGSELTAFPCTTCRGCGKHTDPPFDSKKSKTNRELTCSDASCMGIKSHQCRSNKCALHKHYYEGSSWGAYAQEDLFWSIDPQSLGGSHFTEEQVKKNTLTFLFGCQDSAKGLFVTQVANGIMGFADTKNNLVWRLQEEKKLQHKVFTMCFTALWPRQHKMNAGLVALGGMDPALHTGKIEYASRLLDHSMMRSHAGIYLVSITDIRINGKSIGSLPNAARAAIIDSGTQDSYCPSSVSRPFLQAWKKVSPRDSMSSYTITLYRHSPAFTLWLSVAACTMVQFPRRRHDRSCKEKDTPVGGVCFQGAQRWCGHSNTDAAGPLHRAINS